MTIMLYPNGQKVDLARSTASKQTVRFVYTNAAAEEVSVAGSFNNWNPTSDPLSRVGAEHWVKDLELPFGRYEYQFVVDGRWMPDRTAELVDNPLGEVNSVCYVHRPSFNSASITGRQPAVDRKWLWHYRTLLAMRERLLEERAAQLKEATAPIEANRGNSGEYATDEWEHEQAMDELNFEENRLYEVEEAIHRIINGTYGRCELTGERIPAARLRAIPWARFSQEAETALEAKQERSNLDKHEARA